MLYLNGKSLLEIPLCERRGHLHQSFNQCQDFMFARFRDIDANFDVLPYLLDDSLKDNCEGLMLKSLHATYEPSKRSTNWFKFKKDYLEGSSVADSMDLVVVGADWGKGKRKGLFGSFLLACYDVEG